MNTPNPTTPFSLDERDLIDHRLGYIKAALERGCVVVATRPHQMLEGDTHKIIDDVEFHVGCDADLKTRGGGACNLLDPSYTFAAYMECDIPANAVESLCLAHLDGLSGSV